MRVIAVLCRIFCQQASLNAYHLKGWYVLADSGGVADHSRMSSPAMTPGLNPPQKIPDPVGVAQPYRYSMGVLVRSLQDRSSGGGGTYPGVSLRATSGYDL